VNKFCVNVNVNVNVDITFRNVLYDTKQNPRPPTAQRTEGVYICIFRKKVDKIGLSQIWF